MYVLTVYFNETSMAIYCDSYNEAEEELEKILSKTNVLRYKINCR